MIKIRFFYFCVTVGCYLLFFAFPGKMTIMLAVSVTALPIASLVQFKISSKWLKVEQSLREDYLQKGQATVLSLNFSCPRFVPMVKLEFHEDMSILVSDCKTKWISVAKSRKLESEVYSQYRGKYKIGIKKAVAYDFLELFKKEFTYEPLLCKVFPYEVVLENFSAEYGQESGRRARDLLSQIDRTMVSDLKQYHPQDNMKDINWKASARHGELLVKNYETLSNEGVTIILDLRPNDYDLQQRLELEDRIVSTSLAIIRRLVSSTMPVRLLYTDGNLVKECGRENSLEELLDTTAFVQFNASISLPDMLHTVEYSETGGTVFLVTHNLDAKLCRYMMEQKAYISKHVLFYFEAERDTSLDLKRKRFVGLKEKNILCYRIKQQESETKIVIG